MEGKRKFIYLLWLFVAFVACNSTDEKSKKVDVPFVSARACSASEQKPQNEYRFKANQSYYIQSDTLFSSNTHLVIEEGVTLFISDACNIIVEGNLSILGSKKSPVFLKSQNHSWGSIKLRGKNRMPSIIKNTNFENGVLSVDNACIEVINTNFRYDYNRNFDTPILDIRNSNFTMEQSQIENKLKTFPLKCLVQNGGQANIFNNTFDGASSAIE